MEPAAGNIAEKVTELVTPLAASLGLGIWGVEVLPAGKTIIRIYAESVEKSAGNVSPDVPAGSDEENAPLPEPMSAIPQEDAHTPCPADDDADSDGGADFLPSEGLLGQGGISIDQCADLSRLLGLALEVEDCIEGAYVLEVSSPGLNRLFFKPEQLYKGIGQKVEVTLVSPLPVFPGRKKIIGTIIKVEGDVSVLAVVEPEDAEIAVPWPLVKKMRQIYVPPDKSLPGKSNKNTRYKKALGKKK